MSTETTTRSSNSSTGESAAAWITALLGVWVLITPFFLGDPNAGGWWDFGGNWLYWSNIVTGILIAATAAYAGYAASNGDGDDYDEYDDDEYTA